MMKMNKQKFVLHIRLFSGYTESSLSVRTDAGRREASTGSEHLINNGHETNHRQRLDRGNKPT